tara:strand:- start:342 stop:548 length:207 start_codon:yes stop_codon:yes gene_type:complete
MMIPVDEDEDEDEDDEWIKVGEFRRAESIVDDIGDVALPGRARAGDNLPEKDCISGLASFMCLSSLNR